MGKNAKLADIAEPLGVSTVTVSKALSGQKGVSDEMREKIIALADELGYKQPSVARREEEKKSYNIGVLIHNRYFDKYDSFYLQMYQSVNLKAGSKGCFTMLETISNEMEAEKTPPKLLTEQNVHGIIVIGKMADSYIELLDDVIDVPLIYIDFCDHRRKMDAVFSDNFYGAYSLTQYLVEKGHRDIAYVGTLLSTVSITDRYLGYMKCLIENGIELREEWRIDDRYLETGKVDEINLLQLPEKMPTAFFCNCDLVGSMLVKKLESHGYKIPEDISVVGYDNYLYPGLCDVELTTYEVDIKEMARRAVNNLIKKIKGEKYREGIHIVEGHLVEKDSVKALRK